MPDRTGLAGLAFGLAITAMLGGCGKGDGGRPKQPTPSVDVVTLHSAPVTLVTDLPGRLTAHRIADIRPQVSGLITKRLFIEGDMVKAGQQLYQIDPAPYQASLASAQASVAKARASVATDQAQLNRYRPLAQAQAISRQDLDNAVATLAEAQADVATALANVQTASINLAYTKMASPIAGRTGRSSVTEGALVTANQTTSLVTVTQLDPVYVDVTQPSGTLLRFKRELASGQIKAAGANQAQVKLVLEDGSDYGETGKLQFSEVTVDQSTGSVVLRAIFPNPDGLLLPGMFVREVVEEGVRQDGLLVPQRGVSHDAKGQPFAMVVNQDGVVEQHTLVTDRAIGDDWLVSKGIANGDRVILDGLQKVRPGVAVTVVPATPGVGGSTGSAG